MWEFAERSDDWPHAQQAADALLRLDPRDETILRRVMKATAMGGMVREAEAVYQAFAERAGPPGGWVPAPETSALLRSVRSAIRRPRTTSDAAPSLETEVPLRGRDDELAHLGRSIYRKRGGRPPTCGGGQRRGRNRQDQTRGGSDPRRTLSGLPGPAGGAGRAGARHPIEPVAGCTEPSLDRTVAPHRRGSLGARRSSPWRLTSTTDPPVGRKRLRPARMPSRCVPARPSSISSRRSHATRGRSSSWTTSTGPTVPRSPYSSSSIAAGGRAASRWSCRTVRRSCANTTPASRLVRDLEVDPRLTAVRLGPLDPGTAKQVAAAVSAQSPPDAVLDEIVALAGGNPFFLIELAADHVANRTPELSGDGLALPTSVRQVVGRRVAQLNSGAMGVIAGLAVYGRPVTLRRLSRSPAPGAASAWTPWRRFGGFGSCDGRNGVSGPATRSFGERSTTTSTTPAAPCSTPRRPRCCAPAPARRWTRSPFTTFAPESRSWPGSTRWRPPTTNPEARSATCAFCGWPTTPAKNRAAAPPQSVWRGRTTTFGSWRRRSATARRL